MSGLPIDVIDHPQTPRPALPAATAVLLRDGSRGLEVLMVRRNSKTAFGGMWAFPGGVIEHEDIPDDSAPDPMPAARVAVVRETREEVGLELDESSLVLLSHWLPPADSPVRFSTWFFAAPVPPGSVEVDGGEIHEHRWLQPTEAMRLRNEGEIELVTPTFVTLHNLTRHETVSSAVEKPEPFHYATRIGKTASGVRVCMYHGDVAYESGRVDDEGARHRLTMDDSAGWRWENSG
ncbi:MAG: NUDIX hydrolase [Actinomycetia bacterium]|nr:NUDIX hydrolase [Actinomycetes bacterium]